MAKSYTLKLFVGVLSSFHPLQKTAEKLFFRNTNDEVKLLMREEQEAATGNVSAIRDIAV